MGKHRQINKALRDAKDQRVLVAADAAMQRGDRQALETVLGITGHQTWSVHGLDVWGNEEDGFDINDIYPSRGQIQLRRRGDGADAVITALTENNFLNETATVDNVAVDFNDDVIDIMDARTGEPMFQLHRGTGPRGCWVERHR